MKGFCIVTPGHKVFTSKLVGYDFLPKYAFSGGSHTVLYSILRDKGTGVVQV